MAGHLRDRDKEREQHLHTEAGQSNTTREHIVEGRVSDPDPDPQDPHVFALPGSA